jgi:hypothetical protein
LPEVQTGEKILNIGHVHEKIAEAHLFLAKMKEQERQLVGEPFSHYLSAFLAAGMSVRDPFRDKAIKDWREKWEGSLTTHQKLLYHSMCEGRHDEAHIARKSRPGGSRRRARKVSLSLCVGQEDIKIGPGSSYSDRSSRVEAFGSPSILFGLGVNTSVTIHKQTYSFNIGGNVRKATEFCAEYLELLQRMATQFEADHPIIAC